MFAACSPLAEEFPRSIELPLKQSSESTSSKYNSKSLLCPNKRKDYKYKYNMIITNQTNAFYIDTINVSCENMQKGETGTSHGERPHKSHTKQCEYVQKQN